MKNEFDESLLSGGRTAAKVVRIGNTVRRSCGPRSEFTHALLNLLEQQNYSYAPRFLGIDENNGEILTFIDGDVPHGEMQWTHDQLIKAVKMMGAFHDETAGSDLAGNSEVICHNDCAPWNTVMKDGMPVAFIDFDDAAPGKRVDDIAYFLWTFLEIGSDVPVDIQAAKMRMLCDAYGYTGSGTLLVDALLEQQKKILFMRKMLAEHAQDQESREFSKTKAAQILLEIEWVQKNRAIIERTF